MKQQIWDMECENETTDMECENETTDMGYGM